jgi:hypothetical protein
MSNDCYCICILPRYIQSMLQLLQRIQAKADSERAAKVEQVKQALVTLADYKEQARLAKLEAQRLYHAETRIEYKRLDLTEYNRLCNSAPQIFINVFEEPLPQDKASQYAVVFELLAPADIVVLREALCTLAHDVCHMPVNYITNHGYWRDHPDLSQYCTSMIFTATVRLCSTCKRFKGSHYRAPRVYSTSVTDDFLKPCGYNLVMSCTANMSATQSPFSGQPTVKADCTLVVTQQPYSVLQRSLETTERTENAVIAWQSKCPVNLSLQEAVAYGTLRAGEHLQLHNLIRCIEIRCIELRQLSFEKQSVVALIMQTLWQCDSNECDHWHRDAHYVIGNEHEANNFCPRLLQSLNTWLDEIECNFERDSVLHTIILIATRILDMSQGTDDTAVATLLRCRTVAFRWCARIETALAQLATDVHDINTAASSQALRTKLVDVCAYAALTFGAGVSGSNSGSAHTKLLANAEAVTQWLVCRARMHDNLLLSTATAKRDAGAYRTQPYRRVYIVALDIEQHIIQYVSSSEAACITEFVKIHWSAATDITSLVWTRYPAPHHQWFVSEVQLSGSTVKRKLQVICYTPNMLFCC